MSDIQSIKHIDIDESKLKLIPMLSMYPNLQSISIRNVESLTGEIIRQISARCPKLTSLTIENADGLHGIDVSTFENLQFLTIRSNQDLRTIDGLAKLKNISSAEIYDNTALINTSKICSDLVRIIGNGTSLNLDVLMYPKMQKAISQHNDKIQKGIIQGELITQQMQDDTLLWSEMINRQFNYTQRTEKREQKCTYRNYTMREIDRRADSIISSYIEPGDTEEQKFTILYDFLKENVEYNHTAAADTTKRMEFHTGKTNANGLADGFFHGTCVCEGYVRMFQYLLSKCGIKSQEVGCLYNADKIEEGYKGSDHSMIKTYLQRGTYLSDITFDAGRFRENQYSYKYYLLSKDEMSQTRSSQGRDWDVSEMPFPREEKWNLKTFAEERIKSRGRKTTDILRSATQATETRTRTGEINNQATIIRNNQRQMVQNIETEIDNSQEK